MPAIHDPASRTLAPAPASRINGRRGMIAGAVLFLACAAACSLPVLLAGGVALSAGAFFTGGEGIALTVLAVTAAVGGLLWLRRRRSQARSSDCGCGGCGC